MVRLVSGRDAGGGLFAERYLGVGVAGRCAPAMGPLGILRITSLYTPCLGMYTVGCAKGIGSCPSVVGSMAERCVVGVSVVGLLHGGGWFGVVADSFELVSIG